jgi:hypothetical protein
MIYVECKVLWLVAEMIQDFANCPLKELTILHRCTGILTCILGIYFIQDSSYIHLK